MVELTKSSVRKKSVVGCLIILIISINNTCFLSESQLEYFPGNLGMSTILPALDNDFLSMPNATVMVTAEIKDEVKYSVNLKFDCNYSIYNPTFTMNTTIAVPISFDLSYYFDKNITAWLNRNEIELQECDRAIRKELENDFNLYDYRILCLDNINLPGNSISSIRICAEAASLISKGRSSSILKTSFELQSAGKWKGNINKTIEFIVHGNQPFEYSNYSTTTPDRKCLITNYEDSSSYFWIWENERIIEEQVYLKWIFPRGKPFTLLVESKIVFVLLAIVSSTFFIFRIKFQRNVKGKRFNE